MGIPLPLIQQEGSFPDTAESDAKEISVKKNAPATDISHLVRKRVSACKHSVNSLELVTIVIKFYVF